MKFLVVDDSKLSRTKISSIIKELGYEVVAEACDGLEGLEKYTEFQPDWVLLDLEMPNLNGIELTKRIMSLNEKANIMLISSIVDKKEILMALRAGVKKVLQKPVSINDLANALSELNQ